MARKEALGRHRGSRQDHAGVEGFLHRRQEAQQGQGGQASPVFLTPLSYPLISVTSPEISLLSLAACPCVMGL